ncbi:nitrate reductase molybdenum cofactor assembly chaperone [Agrilactobacillus fermenti]|uniref:nitrate reductase molybdenum cofactor assembly chaperone n=1 Tax=Agrilactobacillus fermenti TaxID=2586909 RepID=UPI001E2AED04|nr:nitrate reductase molybdenum cofactor assembly chaperone [Agrilactobacillus fermenti]MCD2255671.1 nitrate reductase molybdenum cofactor assembly chaperone [Agrilactobacillus fermenti]
MINLAQLDQSRGDFYTLSHLIDYPQAEIQGSDFMANFEREYDANSAEKAQVRDIISAFQQQPLTQLQQEYASLFDMNKRFTLYLTFYRFEDSRERGGVLAKLKMLYEMFGVSAVDQELTDYLPLMLEFLAYGDWENEVAERLKDLQLLFSVVEDGTYQLLQNGMIYADKPYFKLIRVIRQELGKCVAQHQINAQQEVK